MKRLLLIALFGCLSGAKAFAAPPANIDGVYKVRFANGDVAGDNYMSENILELVPVSPDAYYFRISEAFYNGHECGIWGVAKREGDALVFRHAIPAAAQVPSPCELKLHLRSGGIATDDVSGTCRSVTCGARGGYGDGTNISFPWAAKRPIRYMAKLKASHEYAWATADAVGEPIPVAATPPF